MKRTTDIHGPFRELLARRLDEHLAPPETEALNRHLRTCAACASVDRDYRETRHLLRALPDATPPRDLWARTSTALDRALVGAP
nr:zf-HC2 domain-containing protein [Chloroflexota bacterium]